MTTNLYSFECKTIDAEIISLDKFKDQVLLIVNTASKCGFTPQYQGLEDLYLEFREKGFSVLGFPCNQFGHQEPGNEEDIKSFCDLNFKTTFPMFSKIEVNGNNTHPLYQWLKKEAPGILGTERIKWNFTKFLINRKGEVIKRFGSKDNPESIKKHIEALL